MSSEPSSRVAAVAQEPPGTSPPRHATSRGFADVTRNERPDYRTNRGFRCPRGTLTAERRNRGYTFYSARSGALVARLRPTGTEGSFEVLYWSLWKERWASTGPFGRTVLSIDDALRFIAHEDIFWVMT